MVTLTGPVSGLAIEDLALTGDCEAVGTANLVADGQGVAYTFVVTYWLKSASCKIDLALDAVTPPIAAP